MQTIFHWIISAAAIGVAAYLLPSVQVTLVAALVTAVVLGLFNVLLKPILVILTLPVNILTLGLFTLVINAGIIMLVGYVVPGFQVGGFLSALLFSIVLALVNMAFGMFAKGE